MPIYEYQCKACGHHFETVQSFQDDPLTQCPACHKENALNKLISAPAFQLKGTGWYATDFKDKGKKVETKTENKENPKDDTGKPESTEKSEDKKKSDTKD